MIAKKPLTPRQYHALKFDINKLPDVKAAGHISASILSAARDPLRMVYCQREQTDAMNWGSLVDCLWTTPSLFATEYAVAPSDAPRDVRTDSRIMGAKKPSQDSLDKIAWWNDFDKVTAGKTVITEDQLKNAKAAVAMLNQNALSASIREESQTQVAFVGDSPFIEGAKTKALLDFLPASGPFVDAIVDLKTTGQMSEGQLGSTAFTFDYAFKLAFYGLLAELAGCGERRRGVLIWQNSQFPYEVKVREFPKAQMDMARNMLSSRHATLQRINPTDMRQHFDTELKEMPSPDWIMNAMMRGE